MFAGAQSLTQVLWFHSRSRIRLEVLRILFTFQMKTLRFRDTMSFAQDHTAQEGMSWYQNPWLPGLKDGGVSSLLRSWEAYTERQWDSSSPDIGLTNFTSFLKNLALRTSALLPLISVALQTSKFVTKTASPWSVEIDVLKQMWSEAQEQGGWMATSGESDTRCFKGQIATPSGTCLVV